ncbi:MAG: 16S rRNA (guanine(527)-N(7))-methyltransferase RsmG [Robiginitomaculum sp.]|nr:16S rRNA (guanine(527)-N(7))-methyltransferase RsmG [Robiginitomaculum sp.]
MNAEQFQHQTNVSRETLDSYQIWYDLLSRWNKKINLVAPATLHDFWLRHALDCWQVVGLLPAHTKTIIDMGAGAGFPGLAMAIGLKAVPGANIMLVESNGKKCNFLRTVIRELALPATAVQERVENLPPAPYDIITARAFAPLPKLLGYSLPFWGAQTTALFPKGAHWQDELTAAQNTYDFTLTTTNSQTADNAKILTITNLTVRENGQ